MGNVRRLLAAAFLLALPAGASAQTASEPAPIDLIATLNTVCVAAQGDADRAATLAAEGGFSPVPESMLPRMRNSSRRAGFMRSNATDMSFVFTGRMTRRVGRETVIMEFCGVSARPTDHRALDDRLRSVMGFPAIIAAGFEAYAWLQTPEGRAPARSLPDAQFLAMAGTGQMRLVGLDRSGPGSTLLYLLPRLD
ncbi:MAG: hypothetical protein K2X25_14325 [Caulobacteraceae bacterium]|nr:hypothetical protein [Caulobacteraceae bacterium]